ncbi:unnamed protein product [Caenorhabditis auriculariae]|uniref:Uncharacterized protein n=1 Tax=Caenorhabditis auriculariae TaxID=2777116 RepID=A0A8S1H581_9PELO|nr:unnamed protein product [Caenorhabditis auriculariae]
MTTEIVIGGKQVLAGFAPSTCPATLMSLGREYCYVTGTQPVELQSAWNLSFECKKPLLISSGPSKNLCPWLRYSNKEANLARSYKEKIALVAVAVRGYYARGNSAPGQQPFLLTCTFRCRAAVGTSCVTTAEGEKRLKKTRRRAGKDRVEIRLFSRSEGVARGPLVIRDCASSAAIVSGDVSTFQTETLGNIAAVMATRRLPRNEMRPSFS